MKKYLGVTSIHSWKSKAHLNNRFISIITGIFLFLYTVCALSSREIQDAKTILQSLVNSYPDRISEIRYIDGDWNIKVNGEIFYWAEGRLLPLTEKDKKDEYQSYSFPLYPQELPVIRKLSHTEQARLTERIRRQESKKYFRHPAFMEALWGMDTYQIAESSVKKVNFLGKTIRVNPYLVEALIQVEKEIRDAAAYNQTVQNWINNLSTAGGYVWRRISGSGNRSLHSFGIAIDLIPHDYRGQQAYWRWSRNLVEKWWEIPYKERYFPPQAVIQAFEKNGFTWGGKWFFFDQIHFEYRPELIELSRISKFGIKL